MADRANFRASLSVVWSMAALAMTVSSHGVAQTQVWAGLDTRFTDNARKTDTNETTDWETRGYLNASFLSDPGRCTSAFDGTLRYTWWPESTFDDDAFGEMDFNGACELAQGLYWDASNSLREVTRNSRASSTQDNRTRKNVFGTGPRYTWRMTNTDWLTLRALYENTEFEESQKPDTERYSGTIAWNHLFSPTFNGGLSTSYNQTEYDNGAEVDVTSVQVTFDNRWAATRLSGAVGVSEIESTSAGSSLTSDGFVGELDLQREITQSSSVYLRGARELTDRTSTFDIRFGEFVFNLQETISVETTTLSTGYNQRFSAGDTVNAEVYANRADYLESDEREDRTGISLRYNRPVAELTTAFAELGYERLAFESDDQTDNLARLTLGVEHSVTRDLNLIARLGREQKNSDDAAREYTEHFVLVGAEYRLY